MLVSAGSSPVTPIMACSSVVERLTVNQNVVGSNPTRRNLMAYSPTVERLPVKQDVAGSNPAMPV